MHSMSAELYAKLSIRNNIPENTSKDLIDSGFDLVQDIMDDERRMSMC